MLPVQRILLSPCRLMISLVSGFQLLNTLRTGHLQLHKSLFTAAHFDFTTAHFFTTAHLKYALSQWSHGIEKAARFDGGEHWWIVVQLTDWLVIRRSSVVVKETVVIFRAPARTNWQRVADVGRSRSVDRTQNLSIVSIYDLELMYAWTLGADDRWTQVNDQKQTSRDLSWRRHRVSCRASAT